MRPEGVALVTGASRGIGRAVALELARQGFDVVAAMRDPADGTSLLADAAAESHPCSITVQALDVTVADSIVIPEGLRVLVNNAAIDDRNIPFEDTPLDVWRRVFDTNVFGVVEMTRRAVPVMREGGGGVICNLSTAGLLVPMPFFGVYRAGKAAISALGESLRAELAPHGIRIVEIFPGPVATDMLAASASVPEAVESPAYRRLAEVVAEARGGMDDLAVTPAEAAVAIVEAVLDDERGLRSGCDPIGSSLLDAWQRSSDEENQAGYLAAFRVPPE